MNFEKYIQDFIEEELPENSLELLGKLYQQDKKFRGLVNAQDNKITDIPQNLDLKKIFSPEEMLSLLEDKEESDEDIPEMDWNRIIDKAQKEGVDLERLGIPVPSIWNEDISYAEEQMARCRSVEQPHSPKAVESQTAICFNCDAPLPDFVISAEENNLIEKVHKKEEVAYHTICCTNCGKANAIPFYPHNPVGISEERLRIKKGIQDLQDVCFSLSPQALEGFLQECKVILDKYKEKSL